VSTKLKKIKSIFNNNSGATLIELMVAFSLISFIAMALTKFMVDSNSNVDSLSTATNRDLILVRLQKLAQNNRALKLTSDYPANNMFANCTGGAGFTPNSCNHNVSQPLVLLDNQGSPVSGTASQRVYYDNDGNLCPAAGVGGCTFAHSVTIQISIQPISTTNNRLSLKARSAKVVASLPFSYGPGVQDYLAKYDNNGILTNAGGSKEIPGPGSDFFVGVGHTVSSGLNPDEILDINGELRLRQPAALPATCTGIEGGSIRYNPAFPVTEFCNGSTWFPMGPYSGATSPPPPPPGMGYVVVGTASCTMHITGNCPGTCGFPVGSWEYATYNVPPGACEPTWNFSGGAGWGPPYGPYHCPPGTDFVYLSPTAFNCMGWR
jgi:Tfp pilus assembly protein PilV